MGVHPHAPMKGVQSPCPLLVPVFREAYDRTKTTEEGRASALRGRLQSVDPTKLNARSSEVALAPRAAGRAEVRSILNVDSDSEPRSAQRAGAPPTGRRARGSWLGVAASHHRRRPGAHPHRIVFVVVALEELVDRCWRLRRIEQTELV